MADARAAAFFDLDRTLLRRSSALAMPAHELQRLRVDERAQHRLHRLRDELAHRLGREAAQDDEAVLGSAPHSFVARSAEDEEKLPCRRFCELPARDQPAPMERPGERERRRAA